MAGTLTCARERESFFTVIGWEDVRWDKRYKLNTTFKSPHNHEGLGSTQQEYKSMIIEALWLQRLSFDVTKFRNYCTLWYYWSYTIQRSKLRYKYDNYGASGNTDHTTCVPHLSHLFKRARAWLNEPYWTRYRAVTLVKGSIALKHGSDPLVWVHPKSKWIEDRTPQL